MTGTTDNLEGCGFVIDLEHRAGGIAAGHRNIAHKLAGKVERRVGGKQRVAEVSGYGGETRQRGVVDHDRVVAAVQVKRFKACQRGRMRQIVGLARALEVEIIVTPST